MKAIVRYILLLVGIALVTGGIYVVSVSAQNTWAPPTANFPQGNTYPPLDTGPSEQKARNDKFILGPEGVLKLNASNANEGKIIFQNIGTRSVLELEQYHYVKSGGNHLYLADMEGNIRINSLTKNFTINTQGLVLPKMDLEKTGITGVKGMIVFDSKLNKIRMCAADTCPDASKWTDVGTGTVTVTGGAAVGWLRNNTNNFIYLATSTDKVGIGTKGPVAKLQVDGSRISIVRGETAGEARYHLYNQGKVAEWAFGQKSGTEHKFTLSKIVAGAESDYVTIDASGNVGIGTTSPGAKLEVYSIGMNPEADNVLRFKRSGEGVGLVMSSDFRMGRDGALVINTRGALKLETRGLDLPKADFGSGSPTGSDGRIYFDTKDKVIKLDRGEGIGWVDIGAVTGGAALSYPLVLPGGNLATDMGGFDFTIGKNEWTGFDLRGGDKKRIILGVEKGSSRNVFSIESIEGSVWAHMMELRSDGSGFFKKNVEVGDTGQGNPQIRISDEGDSAMIQSYNGGLAINPLGNSVGIGTNNPQFPLTVSSTVDSAFGLYRYGAANPTVFKVGTDSAFVVDSGGFSNMVVLKNGYVGIDITNPRSKLSVNGGVSVGSLYTIKEAPSNGMIIQGSVGIGTENPVSSLHVSGGDLQIDGNVRVLGDSSSPAVFYYGSSVIAEYKEIPYNFNPSTAPSTEQKTYWGEERTSNRMSCDIFLTNVDCSNSTGNFVENDTRSNLKYDLFIRYYKQGTYIGECPLPPNGRAPGECRYYAAAQSFEKKEVRGGLVHYYTLTGQVGGVWVGGSGSSYQQEFDRDLVNSLRLDCDKDVSLEDCPYQYSPMGLDITSPPKRYDLYKIRECDEYNVCNRYVEYDIANEYTLVSVEKMSDNGNITASGSVSAGALKIKPRNGFVIGLCSSERIGELRYFNDNDSMCYCRRGSGGSFNWKCF